MAKEELNQELKETMDIIVGQGSDEDIARKIESDINASNGEWQTLKAKFTEYYFDYLSYKEDITDKYKSNTFIPLPFVSIIINKSKIKTAILSSRPYGTAIPEPFDPIMSRQISMTYDQLLDDAQWKKFLDIAAQDCLIYGNAVYQVVHERRVKKMPAFYRNPYTNNLIPLFDDKGERIWRDQVIKDGIRLDNIPIQNFYIPKCVSAEDAMWNSVLFTKSIDELKRVPKVHNLDKLMQLKKTVSTHTSEVDRSDSALHKTPRSNLPVGMFDIHQYVTDEWIYWWPVGAKFLIFRERNPYRAKPFHIAQSYPLNSEPYGLSPLGEGHLMSHTINEVVDVIMDGLNLENNKMWVVNDEIVNDFELRAQQNNIVHVSGLTPQDDVRKSVYALETRAIATEIFPLIQFFDRIHQKVSGGIDTSAGIPALGAETAYENALLAQGPMIRIEDILLNLEESLGQVLYADIQHLNNLYFSESKFIQEFNPNNGQLKEEFEITPQKMWGNYRFRIDWSGRERERVQERAQLTQIAQVVGNMANVNEITAMIIENLMVLSGIKDVDRIQSALEKVIAFNQQVALAQSQKQQGQVGPGESPEKQAMDIISRSTNLKRED